MRAVDTNVLVRLLTRDDVRQTEAAEAFVAPGAWVSHVVLVEATWVLDSVYELAKQRLVRALEMLLDHAQLTIQDADVVRVALDRFRHSRADFSDCLVLEIARKAGHVPLGTFDRVLGAIEGAERLRSQ
jgi:predicted nucleic-acid-binding protein